MKTILFGDIHGRDIWKNILNKTEYDVAVFVGDYFDTREGIDPKIQIDNFLELCEKKKRDNNIVLLLGNHDFHYIFDENYSGYQSYFAIDIREAILDNIDYLSMCYVIDDKYLVSHAGITKTWLKSVGGNDVFNKDVIPTVLNDYLIYDRSVFSFRRNRGKSMYGDDITQSCIWVRPHSLSIDMVDDYVQIVGHTTEDKIKSYNDKIYFIDVLGTSKETLLIEDGNITINPYPGTINSVAF